MLKDRVMELLEQNRGAFLSGEEIASRLSVSRAAVWKAVGLLKQEGCRIEAVRNRGYRLDESNDILSSGSIAGDMKHSLPEIQVFRELASTNATAKERAAAGAAEGTLIVAETQTGGKGRRGRAFYSPGKTGIYFSLILRPRLAAQDAVLITAAAAVAVCETVEALTGKQAGIKWVNDIFVDGKKVCGILSEASFDMESAQVEFVVLGIGVNLFRPQDGFPPEIADVAGALFSKEQAGLRSRMVAGVTDRFLDYNSRLAAADFSDEYRRRSVLIGREIVYERQGICHSARVLDIDDRCRLKVLTDEGKTELLVSGEVSVGSGRMIGSENRNGEG